jgi:hypothetical protein
MCKEKDHDYRFGRCKGCKQEHTLFNGRCLNCNTSLGEVEMPEFLKSLFENTEQ